MANGMTTRMMARANKQSGNAARTRRSNVQGGENPVQKSQLDTARDNNNTRLVKADGEPAQQHRLDDTVVETRNENENANTVETGNTIEEASLGEGEVGDENTVKTLNPVETAIQETVKETIKGAVGNMVNTIIPHQTAINCSPIILVALLSWLLYYVFLAQMMAPVVTPEDEVKSHLCTLQFDVFTEFGRHRSLYNLANITFSDEKPDDIVDSCQREVGKTAERDPDDDGEFNWRMAVVNDACLVLLDEKHRRRYNQEVYGPSGLIDLDAAETRYQEATDKQYRKVWKREGEKVSRMQLQVDAELRDICKGYF